MATATPRASQTDASRASGDTDADQKQQKKLSENPFYMMDTHHGEKRRLPKRLLLLPHLLHPHRMVAIAAVSLMAATALVPPTMRLGPATSKMATIIGCL